MHTLELALSHITHGTAYSWDLTTLVGLGVPVSVELRRRMLAGTTTQEDADHLRILLPGKAGRPRMDPDGVFSGDWDSPPLDYPYLESEIGVNT